MIFLFFNDLLPSMVMSCIADWWAESASPCSYTHSLRIRITSYTCNKYEQIMPSYLLSVK